MAPTTPKTNFRTFDVQARLLRAIVAAHPEVKWNYKEIMKSYGTDVTEHKLGHRMRHLKTQAEIIRRGLQQGFDPKDMPTEFNFPKDQNKIDTDICKYFGESTPDGIQFQFRTIKKDAASLKAAADGGKNPATAVSFGPSTPSSRASAAGKATPRSRATPKTASHSRPHPNSFIPPCQKAKPAPAQPSAAVVAVAAVDLTSEDDDCVPTPTPAIESFHTTGSETTVSKDTTQPHSFYGTESFDTSYSLDSSLLGLDDFGHDVGQIDADVYAHDLYADPEI
ncbi:unnamed protein product [Parascedosporium putredinis]|uniref:Uncharacterized protein n=1 Tax=Parascedosporium putredinis TaxID=1442378 RepID=A0A9P1GUR2_9PEZI|nr:unnamed protein product [Parascedosporium putredinis]CAI7987466.1 unnamed protein product [Parascedosporium putredinis]